MMKGSRRMQRNKLNTNRKLGTDQAKSVSLQQNFNLKTGQMTPETKREQALEQVSELISQKKFNIQMSEES